MAKPELGTKRLCAHCSAKFYDLNKDPIVCPKCGAVHEIAPVVTRGRPDAAAAAAAAARAAAPVPVAVEEVAVAEPPDAEFVSLEEADAEAQGAKKPGEATEPEEEEVEMDEGIDDAAFIEEQEEEDADVTDIIGGDIENEEEG
ncbi:MAG TPA: TIGR02300 family protein [Xanthobacteraceae bacterium]|nr:TIGR02300 family protein [Xanthobacteraceae bacterium]